MRHRREPGERGSAVVDFVLVLVVLVPVFLGILQVALVLLVRNTLASAASEGARFAALADNTPADGIERCRALITAAIGDAYADDVTAASGSWLGHPAVTITVRTTLPVIGLLGVRGAVEVSGHAAVETLG